MISPTGTNEIRHDILGSGDYLAPRGDRDHDGVDYRCRPGQTVVAPISGVVTRVARPYADGDYSGIVIQGRHSRVKLFYLQPDESLVGKHVEQGQAIGVAQDISKRYGAKMLPHIHLQVESLDPHLFISAI